MACLTQGQRGLPPHPPHTGEAVNSSQTNELLPVAEDPTNIHLIMVSALMDKNIIRMISSVFQTVLFIHLMSGYCHTGNSQAGFLFQLFRRGETALVCSYVRQLMRPSAHASVCSCVHPVIRPSAHVSIDSCVCPLMRGLLIL